MSRTNSTIWSIASAGGLITMSMPSPSTLRSKSVTSAATSIRASAPRSSPVISQSIHTSRSFTVREPTHEATDRLPRVEACCAGPV
jgi:hypothetical protein